MQEFARIVFRHKPVMFGSSAQGPQSWLAGEDFSARISDDQSGMSATFTDIQTLGILGRTERLAGSQVLEINTLCGHGMVSFNLIKKVIDQVKLGKLTPRQGAALLAKPCACAAFNPRRAEDLLERARLMS